MFLVNFFVSCAIALCIAVIYACLIKCHLGSDKLVGAEKGRACTLIAHFFEHFSHNEYLFVFFKWKSVIFILKKHCALAADVAGKDAVLFKGIFLLSHTVYAVINHGENSSYRGVKSLLGDSAIANCIDDELVVVENVAGHFQVESCIEACNSIVNCAPVGHYKALKAPLAAGNICEELLVFGGVFAVHLVVCAHKCSGLALFNDVLKALEIDLAECALVNYGVAEISVFLVVVTSIVLN